MPPSGSLVSFASPHSPTVPGKPLSPLPLATHAATTGNSSSLEGLSVSAWRYASANQSVDSEGFPSPPTGGALSGSLTGSEGGTPSPRIDWQQTPGGPPVSSSMVTADSEPSPVAIGSPISQQPESCNAQSAHRPEGITAAAGEAVSQQKWSRSEQPPPALPSDQAWHRQSAPHPLRSMPLPALLPVDQQEQAAPPPPSDIDPAAYAAGERAAFLRCFQQALPGQQALGQLFSAVDALHSRLEEEVQHWRQLQLDAAKSGSMLEAAVQRLDHVEQLSLPQLQQKCEELACRMPENLGEVLASLQQVIAAMAQRPPQFGGNGTGRGRSIGGALRFQLHWMLLAAAAYGQNLLSKADVAALILSRRILFTGEPVGAGGRASHQLRAVVSAALFVASVEAAWHGQQRLLRSMPSFAQRMAAPAQLGVRVARVAVWSAALVLAAVQTRAACRAASNSMCAAVEAAALELSKHVRLQRLLSWQWRGQAAVPGRCCCPACSAAVTQREGSAMACSGEGCLGKWA